MGVNLDNSGWRSPLGESGKKRIPPIEFLYFASTSQNHESAHGLLLEHTATAAFCPYFQISRKFLWQNIRTGQPLVSTGWVTHSVSIFKRILFICFWLCWVLLLHRFFSSWDGWGLLPCCRTQTPHYGGFSCGGAHALRSSTRRLWNTDSVAVVHRLNCFRWDLPESGTEAVSPALAGGFFTVEPPRKSSVSIF